MPERIIDIGPGAEAIFAQSDRFNTTLISFNFYLPLDREKVADYALLPFMLTSCGKNYPDFSRLNFSLGKLYGADIFASCEKLGDYLLLKMGLSVIDDRFALDGEEITAGGVGMLLDLIFEPKVENGAFFAEDLEREKRKAIESIKSEMGNKRLYAKTRLIEEMFENDLYSTPKCGTVKQVEAVTGESLYNAWRDMLARAYIRVNIIAAKEPAGVTAKIREKLALADRQNVVNLKGTQPARRRNTVKRVTENMKITQGNLCMGFTVVSEPGEENTPVTVMSSLFGGGPYSLLFMNVREKMSLCYYCAAAAYKEKGLMTVSSGIEPKNAEKAEREILNQLAKIGAGDFSDDEFDAAVNGITDTLRTFCDSQSSLDTWYSNRIFIPLAFTPDEVADKIRSVTREQVARAARSVTLNTVYLLMPTAAEREE